MDRERPGIGAEIPSELYLHYKVEAVGGNEQDLERPWDDGVQGGPILGGTKLRVASLTLFSWNARSLT